MNSHIYLTIFLAATVAVLLVEGYHSSRPRFEPRNRPTFRGILGDYVELPCTVHYSRGAQVSWVKGEEELSRDHMLISEDERLRLRKDSYSNTWMLIINESLSSDAGAYECQVTSMDGMIQTKQFELVLVEPSLNVTWRADSKCGNSFLTGPLSHVRAQCDGEGTYPCCSPYGWCGFGSAHCDCYDCIDYSKKAPRSCPYPFEESVDSDFCYTFGPALVDYDGAEEFCDSLESSLMGFEYLDELSAETRQDIYDSALRPVWIEATTNLGNFFSNLLSGTDLTMMEMHACNVLSEESATEVDCGKLHIPLCIKSTL